MADEQPIVIIKKKGGHAGHHGGAWKVAYSDFITSMMCFFLVMWLVTTSSSATKKGISEYFKNPGIFTTTRYGNPIKMGASGLLKEEGYQPKEKTGKEFDDIQDSKLNKENLIDPKAEIGVGNSAGQEGNAIKLKEHEKQQMYQDVSEKLKEKIEKKLNEIKQAIHKDGEKDKEGENIKVAKKLKDFLGDVQITVDATGINIEIIDTEKVSMFERGSSNIQPDAEEALIALSHALKDLPNNFEIIGHTDSAPFLNKKNYSNWELSSDRANATRRILENAGIDYKKITSVSGKADKDLKDKSDPLSYKNRRITLRMGFTDEQLIDVANDFSKFEDIEVEESKNIEKPMKKRGIKKYKSKKKKNETFTLPDNPTDDMTDIFDIPVIP